MKTIDLSKFENPLELLDWLCNEFGPPESNTNRWAIRELRYIDLNNDMDLTFILLKFNHKE